MRINNNQNLTKNTDTIRDILIGMSDGLIIPFALSVGLSAAQSSSKMILMAGIAVIVSGSIFMALSGYFARKTEESFYGKSLPESSEEAEKKSGKETKELIDIFANIGLSEEVQHLAVEEMEKDREQWTGFIRKFEWGKLTPPPKSASHSAVIIGISYALSGFTPLYPYIFSENPSTALPYSIIITLLCLFLFGFYKNKVTGLPPLYGSIKSALAGSLAAAAALGVALMCQ